MQRYFLKTTVHQDDITSLSETDQNHLVRVLRAQAGTEIEVVDISQKVYTAVLSDDLNHIKIEADITKSVELPIDVTIACGLSKGSKSEFIVKKATELGAKKIVFFESKYSVVHWQGKNIDKKIQRLNKIAQGAAEQSHRQVIPTIEYLTFTDILKTNNDIKLVAYEESAKQNETAKLVQLLNQAKQNMSGSLIALFGPEGGIAPEEIEQLTDNGFELAGLGPRIMRAETAPLYLLSAISYSLELESK